MSEDYAPFDIDVTTVEPASFADGVAVRVAIGGDGAWYGTPAGGVAYVNSFTNPSLPNTVYVFSSVLYSAKNVGEASSHEAGHSFGLQHQSQYDANGGKIAEYYSGPGDGRAPIMGNSYSATRGLWWYGTSTSSTTYQDDLAVISRPTNGFGYRPDDYGDSPDTAAPLTTENGQLDAHGIITSTADRDYFEFETGSGTITLSVTVPNGINNLDSTIELRDMSNGLIASSDPSTGFGATITANVPAGTYCVVVGSHGGYDDIGQYTVTVTAASPTIAGTVFVDANRDGLLDALDWGLAGATVYEDLNGNGQFDATPESVMHATDTPLNVPDLGSQTSSLVVANMTGVILDINVSLSIHHPTTSQLTAILLAPDGTSISLLSHNGGSGDNFLGTTFDAQAATSIAAGAAPFSGSYRPLGDLSRLTLLNPNGTWTLYVSDGTAGDTGVLDDWSLDITTSATEPYATSDSSGQYQLPLALSGLHNLRQVPFPDVLPNTPVGGVHSALAVPGSTTQHVDFGNLGSNIAGLVFRDTNLNGLPDPGESGVPGVTVYDDLNGDGTFNQSSTVSTFTSANVPLPITDHNTTVSQLTIGELSSPIVDANVHLTLTHTYDADLLITLVAPDGTTVTLAQNNGGSGDNYTSTVFDDQAATAIASGTPPFTGSFRPTTPLSVLVGKSAGGVWELDVADQAGGDVGTLVNWSLELLLDAVEPSTVTGPDGSYRFPYVTAGLHSIRIETPGDSSETSPASGHHDVTVAGYTEATEQNFGLAFPSPVLGRFVFYNNSHYDGDPGANALDDAAIATDKQPYRAGDGPSGPQNVTSYAGGINGLMIDLAGGASSITAADFSFKLGSNNSPSTWTTAPAPSTVVVRPNQGLVGGDRVEILWSDGAIENTWLQVTLKGNDAVGGFDTNTGLADSDVFYFGNLIGDDFYGTPANVFLTNVADEIGVRGHYEAGVDVTSVYDFNKDNLVNVADEILARTHVNYLARINLGSPPAAPPSAPLAARNEGTSAALLSALATRRAVASLSVAATSPVAPEVRWTGSSSPVASRPAMGHNTPLGAAATAADSAASTDLALDDELLDRLLGDLLAV